MSKVKSSRHWMVCSIGILAFCSGNYALATNQATLSSSPCKGSDYPYTEHSEKLCKMAEKEQEEEQEQYINEILSQALSQGLRETKRDLSQDLQVQDYLKEHKVYISLTTSPLRIKHINKVLKYLDLTYVEQVLVNIPKRFGRDNSKYKLPKILLNHDKVTFLRTSIDYGPITKMIPSIMYVKNKDPKSIVISIDDDIYYPEGMVNEMIYESVHNHFAVIGSSAGDFPDGGLNWNLPRFPKRKEFEVNYVRQRSGFVDLVEGYGAIAYVPQFVDIEFIRALSNHTKACFFSDDLVISFGLAIDNVPRRNLWSSYFNREMVVPLPHGLQADALHHGAGLLDGMQFENMVDVNYEKYQKCYSSLLDVSYDKSTESFRSKKEIYRRLKEIEPSFAVIPKPMRAKQLNVDVLLNDLEPKE